MENKKVFLKSEELNALLIEYKATKSERVYSELYNALYWYTLTTYTSTKSRKFKQDRPEQFEDIFQDVMINVWLKIDTIDLNKSSIGTFVVNAFKNKLIDLSRLNIYKEEINFTNYLAENEEGGITTSLY